MLIVSESIVRYRRECFTLDFERVGAVPGRVSVDAAAFLDPNNPCLSISTLKVKTRV